MKRNIILVLIVFLAVTGIVSAADLKDVGTAFSLAAGTHLDNLDSGGYGELGFALTKVSEKKGLELRNYFQIFGFGDYLSLDPLGTILGQYKLTFGKFGSKPIVARTYALIAAGAGCGIRAEGVEFIWEMEFGGGAHIYLNPNYILVIETGGGLRSTYGDPLELKGYGYLRVSMGGIW